MLGREGGKGLLFAETFPLQRMSPRTVSYHTVHSKVVVLCLKLHRMRMAGPNLGVAVQKQALVVCDPVKHLPERKRQPGINHSGKRNDLTGPRNGPKPGSAASFR